MKTLKAEKCKNGWLVTIKDRIPVGCESDVYKIIRENGLIYKKELSHKASKENTNTWIYAE